MLEEIMNKQMTRKEFIKTAGILILVVALVPSLIGSVFKFKLNKDNPNKFIINGEEIGEIR